MPLALAHHQTSDNTLPEKTALTTRILTDFDGAPAVWSVEIVRISSPENPECLCTLCTKEIDY